MLVRTRVALFPLMLHEVDNDLEIIGIMKLKIAESNGNRFKGQTVGTGDV